MVLEKYRIVRLIFGVSLLYWGVSGFQVLAQREFREFNPEADYISEIQVIVEFQGEENLRNANELKKNLENVIKIYLEENLNNPERKVSIVSFENFLTNCKFDDSPASENPAFPGNRGERLFFRLRVEIDENGKVLETYLYNCYEKINEPLFLMIITGGGRWLYNKTLDDCRANYQSPFIQDTFCRRIWAFYNAVGILNNPQFKNPKQ